MSLKPIPKDHPYFILKALAKYYAGTKNAEYKNFAVAINNLALDLYGTSTTDEKPLERTEQNREYRKVIATSTDILKHFEFNHIL